jgi:hypothetical protein
MKFGFWFDYDQTFTFVKLYHALAERLPGARATGVVVNDRYWAHAVDGLPVGTRLLNLYALVAEARARQPSREEATAFRALDERLRLGRAASTDRHLARYDHDTLVRVMTGLCAAFADYLDRERPDVFVFNCIASLYAHLFYELLVERGIKVVVPTHTGIGGLFHLFDNPYLLWPEVWETAARWREAPEEADPAATAWARDYVAGLRAQKPAYALTTVALEEARFHLPGPARGLRYLANWWRYDRSDPTLPNPVERLAALARHRVNLRATTRIAEPAEALVGHDYAYLPLHYEPEIATLVLSKHDQRLLIDLAARQLPAGWLLVVKDHPAMTAQRPASYFRELKRRYPNLVVVEARASSQALVAGARLVLTLSGTVVIEALALERPVIYTARARFSGFGLGTYAPDAIEFAPVLDRALAWRPDEPALVAAVAAIRHHGDESYVMAEPLGNPTVLAPANIAALAEAIRRRV